MMNRTLCGIALAMVAGLGLLSTPGTSEARGGGGGGHGGGGGGHGGGGGFHGGGGSFHSRGFYGGGYHRGGFDRGFGRGYGGYGFGLGYWDDGGWPYYDYGYYGGPAYYGSDWYQPNYYYDYSAPATSYFVQPYYTAVPSAAYYGNPPAGQYNQPLPTPNTAEFTVTVPDPNAQIWFQGYLTHERGTVREFESAPLAPGATYTFHIRARWNQGGRQVERTSDVAVTAGQQLNVDFNTAQNQQ